MNQTRDSEASCRFMKKPFLNPTNQTPVVPLFTPFTQPILIKYSRLIRSIITENRCFFPSFLLLFLSFFLFSSFFFPSNAQSLFFFFSYNEVLTSVEGMNVASEEGVKHLTKLERTSDNFQVLRTGRNRFPLVNHAGANLSGV